MQDRKRTSTIHTPTVSGHAPLVVRALLSDPLQNRLRQIHGDLTIQSIVPEDCLMALEWRPNTVYVIDPSELPDGEFINFYRRARDARSRVVVYGPPHPLVLRQVFQAHQIAPLEVVLAGTEGEAIYLGYAIEALGEISVSALTRKSLSASFQRLPSQLFSVCFGMFSGLRIPDSPEELAGMISSRPRTVHERLRVAGFRGADRLAMCARFMRAWPRLSDPLATLSTIARRGGFGDVGRLEYACAVILDAPLRRAASMRVSDVSDRLVRAVLR